MMARALPKYVFSDRDEAYAVKRDIAGDPSLSRFRLYEVEDRTKPGSLRYVWERNPQMAAGRWAQEMEAFIRCDVHVWPPSTEELAEAFGEQIEGLPPERIEEQVRDFLRRVAERGAKKKGE